MRVFWMESRNFIMPALMKDCYSCRARDGMIVSSDTRARIYDERILSRYHDKRQTITKPASRSSNGWSLVRPGPIDGEYVAGSVRRSRSAT